MFERALLVKGFYFVSWEDYGDKYDGFYCACGFDTKLFRKEEGFRLVFKNKAKYIKALLDDDRYLQTIIDDYEDNECWKYYLIKQAPMFKTDTEYGLVIVKKMKK